MKTITYTIVSPSIRPILPLIPDVMPGGTKYAIKRAPFIRLRKVGGLVHWRIGRVGGSFYIAKSK
jgi:hypothetical protein